MEQMRADSDPLMTTYVCSYLSDVSTLSRQHLSSCDIASNQVLKWPFVGQVVNSTSKRGTPFYLDEPLWCFGRSVWAHHGLGFVLSITHAISLSRVSSYVQLATEPNISQSANLKKKILRDLDYIDVLAAQLTTKSRLITTQEVELSDHKREVILKCITIVITL